MSAAPYHYPGYTAVFSLGARHTLLQIVFGHLPQRASNITTRIPVKAVLDANVCQRQKAHIPDIDSNISWL